MRLLHSEPNPLNVLEMRELNFCPSNWTTIRLSTTNWLVSSVLDDIRNWIYNNLEDFVLLLM
jgi:hypothetical protein